jgi:hypothetical protein
MRFYHGTSVRGWLGIIKSGSMDSKKMGDKRVSSLYSKFKGNYLTTNRKIAEMYANKIGKGVIEIEYDPLAPGRKNNFKRQQADGKDYFVEETPLEVDGVDCQIDTRDPLRTKAKMRSVDINKSIGETIMNENSEIALRRAWQKLDEAFSMSGAKEVSMTPGKGKPHPSFFPKGGRKPIGPATPSGKVGVLPPTEIPTTPSGKIGIPMGEGGVETLTDIYPDELTNAKEELGVELTPEQERQVAQIVFSQVNMEAPLDSTYPDDMIDAIKDAIASVTGQPSTQTQGSINLGGVDRKRVESIYEFGGQILDSAEAQGLTIDELQIQTANDSIVRALQGEGMRNPHNLEDIIDDAVYDAANDTRSALAGIFESIDRSLKLIKKLKQIKK